MYAIRSYYGGAVIYPGDPKLGAQGSCRIGAYPGAVKPYKPLADKPVDTRERNLWEIASEDAVHSAP